MKSRKPLRLLGVVAGILLLGLTLAPGALAQVPWAEADFSGSAVGIALHADAVQAGSTRVLNVDEAIGAATVDSQG
ncbi:MAG TPA: hypothetical protein VND22_10060, partial [Actinomycetota bacterium]|nr:hypothetical protein [Actinomycetota bacterium]